MTLSNYKLDSITSHQSLCMLAGQIGSSVLYSLQFWGLLPVYLIFTAPPLGLQLLMYAVALFSFRVFDPIPLARQMTIEQMTAGVIVLDPQGRVININPSATRILPGLNIGNARGQPFSRLFPVYQGAGFADHVHKAIEFGLGEGSKARDYTLTVSPMKDWRGIEVGRLLLLHDVTEPKRTRELHDSIGQVLGYAGMQLKMIHVHLQDGQTVLQNGQGEDVSVEIAQAQQDVTRLNSIVGEAHADLREYILNLRSGPSGTHSFFTSLQRYLDGFRINYDLQTELAIEPGVHEGWFSPDAQMHLFGLFRKRFRIPASMPGRAACGYRFLPMTIWYDYVSRITAAGSIRTRPSAPGTQILVRAILASASCASAPNTWGAASLSGPYTGKAPALSSKCQVRLKGRRSVYACFDRGRPGADCGGVMLPA